MTMILGVLTALTVTVWGLIWYLEGDRRGQLSTHEMKARLRPAGHTALPPEELKALMLPTLLDDEDEDGMLEPTPQKTEAVDAVESEGLPMFVRPAAVTLSDDALITAPQTVRELTEPQQDLMGYCARCRAKRFLVDPEHTTTRQGRPAVRGRCMICDSDMLVFTFDL